MNLVWFLARASGLVSWALLTAGILWGLVLSTKAFRARPRPAWTLDLHRFLGGLAVLFTGIHIAMLVADNYVHFGPAEILLPLASRWHPVAVAWGVVSMYILLAVEGTSLIMRKLSNKTWKMIHRTSYALFVFATVHALTAGTDTTGVALRWTSIVFSGLISFLWLARIANGKAARNRQAHTERGRGSIAAGQTPMSRRMNNATPSVAMTAASAASTTR